jgi:hypothetical protein
MMAIVRRGRRANQRALLALTLAGLAFAFAATLGRGVGATPRK